MDNDIWRLLRNGANAWNSWRKTNPNARPNLAGADISGNLSILPGLFIPRLVIEGDSRLNLRNYDFHGVDFGRSNLSGADLRGCNLIGASFASASLSSVSLQGLDLRQAEFRHSDLQSADLRRADLGGANLWGAHLLRANLAGATLVQAKLDFTTIVEADLSGADLTGASVYGMSAWSLETDTDTRQSDLVIRPFEETEIIVDNLEVAQFIYLLLHNQKIRDVIDTVGKKTVLILGRFSKKRIAILEAIREELRKHNYIPILFDFEKPSSKNLTETVSTLAHMARFIVADISNPKSIPQELQRVVPHLPSVPVQPLLQGASKQYGMFESFMDYPWVLKIYRYKNTEDLISSISEKVIIPAESKAKEIEERRRLKGNELAKRKKRR